MILGESGGIKGHVLDFRRTWSNQIEVTVKRAHFCRKILPVR
jgi:hypothetical protein